METLKQCGACGASVGRNQFSNYWMCDNGHVIYRGIEEQAVQYELRRIPASELTEDQMLDASGPWTVWDLLSDQPFYDSVSDEYAWLIAEDRARSVLRRLLIRLI